MFQAHAIVLQAYVVMISFNPTISTSETDYISGNYMVVFQPGETAVELRVPILDDSLGVEGTEDFLADLTIPTSSMYLGVSAGSIDITIVSILDDDNVTVQFNMSEYKVSEGTGEVTLYISSDIPGEVNYTLYVDLGNGTAQSKYISIVRCDSPACPKLC